MGITHLSFAMALGASAWGAAPDAEPPPRAEASATVTVTAEALPVELARTPNPVKVLDAEAIRATGARTLDELLPLLLPGQIQAFGGAGTAASLYLGGGRARDVIVLLDGIRVTDPSGLSPNFADYALAGIDRVEVLQGPASTRYGSDAHGGVVALYSAGPARPGFSLEAAAAAGSRGLGELRAAPAYAWNGGWVRAGLSGSREDAAIPADQAFRSAAGALSLGQKVGDDALATLTLRDHHRDTPLPLVWAYAPPTWAVTREFDPARRETEQDRDLIAAWRQTLGSAWLLEASFGHVAGARVEPGFSPGDPAMDYRGQRNQLLGSLTWTPAAAWRVNVLVDHSGENAELAGDRATARHSAAALELSRDWASGLRAVVSGRYQQDSIAYTSAAGAALPQRDSGRFVYKAGLNWLWASGLRCYASYGTSYNTPDLSSLTHNLANPAYGDLANELSHGGQLGASLERGPWLLKLEASRTLYDQIVTYVDLGPDGYKYANGTNLRVQGVEASAAFALAGWRLEGFARSQEARNLSQPQADQLTTSGATGRPFFSGGLRLVGTWRDWRLAARWARTGSSYQYFDDLGGVQGVHCHFDDLALGLTWSQRPGLAWTLRAEHLLQRAWSREEWLAGSVLGRNDAYVVPVFPAAGPICSLTLSCRL